MVSALDDWLRSCRCPCRRRRHLRRHRQLRRRRPWWSDDSETDATKGEKIATGSMVAWGTNWAMTPATGVPWPSNVLARTWPVVVPPPPVPPAPPAPPPPPVVVPPPVAARVLVAQAAGVDVRCPARRDRGTVRSWRRRRYRPRPRRCSAVVGNGQGPKVVQADQGAARRVGQAGGGLELPDAVSVRRIEGRAVRREGDGELGVDEGAERRLLPEVLNPAANVFMTPCGSDPHDPAADVRSRRVAGRRSGPADW